MRQIVLDTETTGLEHEADHRIIEIGCVELANRRLTGNDLHIYINPERGVDEGAQAVHGITDEFLEDKPCFGEIAEELVAYLGDAELIIHNAPFDLGFLNAELRRLEPERADVEATRAVRDTLIEARRMFPGQRNSLDALCKRLGVDDSTRELHGALLDAQLLAEVYLAMTGGQTAIQFADPADSGGAQAETTSVADRLAAAGRRPAVVAASPDEQSLHTRYLARLDEASDGACLWRALDSAG